MTKRRKKHIDSWIQVVTILTVVGLVALGALGVYYFMQQRSSQDRPYNHRSKIVYRKPSNPWVRSITPSRVQSLKRQVELPLEVVRNKPSYLKPKRRKQYLKERVDRLDRNIALLKKTQSQQEALKDLERRIKSLQMIDTLY